MNWRLSWDPGMNGVLQKMNTHTNSLRMFGGTTWGTPLQIYGGLILTCPLYSLPLVTLRVHQLKKNTKKHEQAQSVALRIFLCVRRTASSRLTLTEARINSVENTLQERVRGHLIRMRNCDSTTTLLITIAQRSDSQVGTHVCTLGDIAGMPAPFVPLPALERAPPTDDQSLHTRSAGQHSSGRHKATLSGSSGCSVRGMESCVH